MANGRKQQVYAYKTERDLDNSLEVNRRILGINQTGSNPAKPIYSVLYVRVTELIDGTDGKEAKGIENVFDATNNDFVEPDEPWLFDKDALDAGDDRSEGNIHSNQTMVVDEIVRVEFYPDETEVAFYLAQKQSSEAELSYCQITDVDYTQDNDSDTASYVYRGITVDNLFSGTVISPPEEDKFNIIIYGGYPWNLKVGDNLTVINQINELRICNNDIEPEPIIKVVSGGFEVWDDETGSSLTPVRPDFRIMTDPAGISVAAYNDVFPIAQWSKRSNVVRIYFPVI